MKRLATILGAFVLGLLLTAGAGTLNRWEPLEVLGLGVALITARYACREWLGLGNERRYQITNGKAHTFLLDTSTGESWWAEHKEGYGLINPGKPTWRPAHKAAKK